MLRKKFQRSLHVITYLSPKCLKGVGKVEKTDIFFQKPGVRQSWTKILGTVMRYSYIPVICGFPNKTVHPFRNFLPVFCLPPATATLYKVETRKKFWIHASNFICGVRGGVGPVCIGKRSRNAQVSQDCCL